MEILLMRISFFYVCVFIFAFFKVLFNRRMPKRGDLFKAAITDNDSTQALYITCLYVIKNQFSYLEDEWIAMSSHIGKRESMPFGRSWIDINKEISDIIDAEEFHIQRALLCTTKLMLLNQRDIDPITNARVNKLRESVIACFPDKAMLTVSGKELFQKILPNETADTYMFYNRILAGFSKIIAEEDWINYRNGLEYISRKKLNLPLREKWPAASENDAEAGDPCWFLWGMILLVYPNDKNVATQFKLFCSNWRKNVRNERIGLLWGIPYIIDSYNELIWTENDIGIFDKVKGATTDLWNFAVNETKKQSVVEDLKEQSEFETTEKKSLHSFYESFVPRKNDHVNEHEMDLLVESINKNILEKEAEIQRTRVIQFNKNIVNEITDGKKGMSIKKIEV
jgi:hypothetical protein